jgi:hypothetical protein
MFKNIFLRSGLRSHLVTFAAGVIFAGVAAGFFVYRVESGRIRELDTRFAEYERATAETIAGLESNLGRERALEGRARELVKNIAEYGAGVYLEKGAALTLSGGTITENTAEFVGGGIYIQTGATYTAKGGKVEKNAAGDGEGLDIFKQ